MPSLSLRGVLVVNRVRGAEEETWTRPLYESSLIYIGKQIVHSYFIDCVKAAALQHALQTMKILYSQR